MKAPMLNMVYDEDLDVTCSYLTSVNGIDGAGVFDDEGLLWASGADSVPAFFEQAPWLVELLRDGRDFRGRTGGHSPQNLVLFDDASFWFCAKLHDLFYYVVVGSRGSYELFKGRIDRCMQMADQALKERRFIAP